MREEPINGHPKRIVLIIKAVHVKPTHNTPYTDISDSSSISSMASSRSFKNRRRRQPKRGCNSDNSSITGTNKRPPKHHSDIPSSGTRNDPTPQDPMDTGAETGLATS